VISSKKYSNIDITNTLASYVLSLIWSFAGLYYLITHYYCIRGGQAGEYNYLEPAKVLGVMSIMDISPTLGLQNNTLYDVISENDGIGSTSVEALSFDVSCGTLQNMTASWSTGYLGNCQAIGLSCQYIELEWKYKDYQCGFAIPPSITIPGGLDAVGETSISGAGKSAHKTYANILGDRKLILKVDLDSNSPPVLYRQVPLLDLDCMDSTPDRYAPVAVSHSLSPLSQFLFLKSMSII
jgi:hypothetical protein